MKKLFAIFLLFLIGVIFIIFIYPGFSDYRPAVRTEIAIDGTLGYRNVVEQVLLNSDIFEFDKNNIKDRDKITYALFDSTTLKDGNEKHKKNGDLEYSQLIDDIKYTVKITNSGVFALQTEKYELLVMLYPIIINDKVIWECIGRPHYAVPKECKKQPVKE